uniref:Uncharacterized protein n=1 Tax=viral metagenome TaxID=1070528 RepID=A0A6M3JAD3_9ZZZZ
MTHTNAQHTPGAVRAVGGIRALLRGWWGEPREHIEDLMAAIIDRETAAPELLAACHAIADLANGQGRMNMVHVAGIARAAIARAEEGDKS